MIKSYNPTGILGFSYGKETIEENRNLPYDTLYYPLETPYNRQGSFVFLPSGETVEEVETLLRKMQGNQTKFTDLVLR